MHIIFSPSRRDEALTLSRTGDALEINGETFDFSVVPNGATLPKSAIACDLISGPVERDVAGNLTVRLILPHGANAPETARFPDPITLTCDGPVDLPTQTTENPA